MLYIGNFMHISNQENVAEEERRHGEFSLILEADNPEFVLQKFKDRIFDFREASAFFEGDCSIFLMRLLEFEDFPKSEAMMLNYKSFAGDPILPFIGCAIPSEMANRCRIYDWKDNAPEVDGQNEKLFLRFEKNRAIAEA
jgi:hypothetical protein